MTVQGKPAVRLRDVSRDDLPDILIWRNHTDIRRFMYNTEPIAPATHMKWFEAMVSDPRRTSLIVEADGKPIGVVNFTRVLDGNVAEWGFYLVPDAPRGSGMLLGRAALDHAFVDMRLRKVCGEAIAFNEKSIRFHRKLGFVQEGLLRRQCCFEGVCHDVVVFGLLEADWGEGDRKI